MTHTRDPQCSTTALSFSIAAAEVSRMREVEMAKVRSEEAARYRRELDTARDQLRLEYNDKLEK